MRIGCLMVTEKRAPVAGISFASFAAQTWIDKVLLVVAPSERSLDGYLEVRERTGVYPLDHILLPNGNFITRKAAGCDHLFRALGCDMVTIWDDDDYSPPERLATLAEATESWMSSTPTVGCYSYNAGWFCNLRTLRAEWFDAQAAGHLWGGTLAFNESAFNAFDRFNGAPNTGYDRWLQKRLIERGYCIGCIQTGPHVPLDDQGLPVTASPPVAFSHGKNVATWLKSPGEDLECYLQTTMPPAVFAEVKLAQQFLIDRRVFPPQPE